MAIVCTDTLFCAFAVPRWQKTLCRRRSAPRFVLIAIFGGRSSERSWLCGILKNKICDYFRKLGRETCFTDLEFLDDEMSHKFIDQGWNHDVGPAEWKSEAEVLMDRAEFWKTFRNCLSKLPARVVDVFMLREMEEMETAQICQALSISQSNLWVMLHRARMALRECLELNWFGMHPSGDRWLRTINLLLRPQKNLSILSRRNGFERVLVGLIARHTPKCREIVRLLSQSMEVKLPVGTRIKIGFTI